MIKHLYTYIENFTGQNVILDQNTIRVSITEEHKQSTSIITSTLIFKYHSSQNIVPCKENKDNGGEFSLNEVPKVQAVKNHGTSLLINQI